MGLLQVMRHFISAALIASAFFTSPSIAADLSRPTNPEETSVPLQRSDSIFDEARFGVLASVDDSEFYEEDGQFITGMLFFDPWAHREAQGWDRVLRPRIHVGGTIATENDTNQVYGGLSWTADITDRFFLELGLGGTLHDGDLDASDGGDGPKLGCRALFHEYLAAGLNVTEKWSVIAHIEHSSHANLCDGPNNGLSRAGVMVGYKF